MLGPPKGRWGLLALATACFCLLAISPASGAGGKPTIASLQADDATLAAKSRAAVLELYSLDTKLTAATHRLTNLQAVAKELTLERNTLTHEIRIARLDTRLSQTRLASRLRFIYEHGSTSSLEVFMGAKSLTDAMTQLDDFNRVAAVNANVLVQLRTSQKRFTNLETTLAAREHSLAATLDAASTTVTDLARVKAEREAYLTSLAAQRSLDAAGIAKLTAQARAADVKSQTLSAAPAPRVATASTPPQPVSITIVAGGRTMTVVATAYDLPGRTSTGLPVGWGIAAVDPSVIPLGTHLQIPGYGTAIAADTGPSIRGTTIDLWFPTAAQAYAWGRRTITVALD